MKKSLTLAALFAVTVALAQSIVVVDMEEVLARHPNTGGDKKVLESTLEDYTQERNALRAELDRKQADLERKIKEAQNPMLAPAKAEELRKACEIAFRQLEQDQVAAENKMAERSRQLAEMEKRLVKRTSDEILRKISDYAILQGYDLVLYKNLVPYVTTELDITDKIIVLCGGKPVTPVQEVTAPTQKVTAPKQEVTPPVQEVTPPAQPLKAPLKANFETPTVETVPPAIDTTTK